MLVKIKFALFIVVFLLLYFFCVPSQINATAFNKHPLNPIFPPPGSTWTPSAKSPNVLKNENIYHIWYEGNAGYGWRIGYTSSTDGINNWNSAPQPVVPPEPSDGFEKETTDGFVRLDDISGQYQMWFTSFDTTHWHYGPDRFRTRYATSSNGINWIKDTYVLTGTNGAWDSGGTYKGRTIIYRDGTYHMWYGGTNEAELASNPYWRIGYATSSDGLNWIKQNNGNPIIYPTKSWELNNIYYPNVILINGIYHMWYASTLRDEPQQIVYAYSYDGINWAKPEEQNPVLTRGDSGWDAQGIGSPSVILEQDTIKLWYSGSNADYWWRVGYATASADWLPDITPTHSPSPTPSPTPTSTPTPTPTPIPTKPTTQVIVIPGTTASWNSEALVLCKPDSGNKWSLMLGAIDIYNPIQQRLIQEGMVPKVFSYDWRKRVSENAQLLKSYIDSQVVTGEKVNIVGHSMGGLIARSYIEQEGINHKIDKLITAGTPHQGAADAYLTWSSGGIPKSDDIKWRFYVMAIAKFCATKTGGNDRLAIQQYFPSMQDTLPTFDYLIDNQTNQMKPVASMNAKNNWLTSSTFTSPFYGITVGTLSGSGQKTTSAFRVDPPTASDIQNGIWLDGKPVQTITTLEGDNRVLEMSSKLPDVSGETISAGHAETISSTAAVEYIAGFLKGTSMTQMMLNSTSTSQNRHKKPTPSIESPTSGLFVIGYPSKFWIIEPRGKLVKDKDGIISIMNPKSGIYRLIFWPKEKTNRLVVAQILKNDQNFWKEYTLTSHIQRFHHFSIPQIHILKFDAKHPKEDIFR